MLSNLWKLTLRETKKEMESMMYKNANIKSQTFWREMMMIELYWGSKSTKTFEANLILSFLLWERLGRLI